MRQNRAKNKGRQFNMQTNPIRPSKRAHYQIDIERMEKSMRNRSKLRKPAGILFSV